MQATVPISKRRPFPYDAYFGDVKVMLEPQADGNLVSQKTKTLEATAPIDYTYSSANPYKEKAFEWSELFGGLGQGTAASTGSPRRYSIAEKADLSLDGLWMKGPRFGETINGTPVNQQTINAAAGEVRQLVKALHGGTLTLFAICENGVYRRVDDSVSGGWVVSLSAATLGAGVYPQQAIRFKHRGASPLDALYVATSNSNLWRYDGTTWTLAGAAQGPGTGATQGEARYIERVNDELWVAGNYWVVKVTDDPMVRANYAAVIYIGDQTAKITWLRQIDDQLIIFKEDGIYSIDTSGADHELFPTLRGKNDSMNGRNAAVWIDRMWFTFGDQTFTLTGSNMSLSPDGMEQMLENTSPLHGRWIGSAGHNTWFNYELYYAEDIDTTYLVKHGTWVEEGSTQEHPGVAQFADAHHGALYDWDKRATMIDIVPDLMVSGNDRLYVGFLDGTIQYTPLPQHSPNSSKDPQCEFTSLPSYVYLPIHHSGFKADNKLWHAITAMGPTLTAQEWVEVEYRLDVTNSLSAWVKVAPAAPKFTIPSQRLAFTEDEVNDPVYGKLIEIRVGLFKDPNTSASPAFLTPIIEGIVIHESIRPSFSREFSFSIKAASYLPKRNGQVDRRRGVQIRDAILQECARIGPVDVMTPLGETEALTIIDYRDSAASWGKRRDHEWLIVVQGIQLGTLSVEETNPITGLTYGTLEQYTLGELESII